MSDEASRQRAITDAIKDRYRARTKPQPKTREQKIADKAKRLEQDRASRGGDDDDRSPAGDE